MRISQSMAAQNLNFSGMDDDDEEAGEEIESKPPMKEGQEREINSLGLKKKLLKSGRGWECPEIGDEVTVNYGVIRIDGTKIVSSKDRGELFTYKLGQDPICEGLDQGIITMKGHEIALFSLPSSMDKEFEVELISWNPIIDICKDGGLVKKIIYGGESNDKPGDLDEVKVKYEARLVDGTVVARSPEGLEFHVKDGHLCPAILRAVKTMARGEKAFLSVASHYAVGDGGRNYMDENCCIPFNANLNIDIELISFKRVVDIMGDLSILKKILREGEGLSTPNDGAIVNVRWTGMLDDGTIFEKMGFLEEGTSFTIDEEEVTFGLDRAVATMKKGELSVVTIKPVYGFGEAEVKRDLAVVPANSMLTYEIEMVNFKREKEPWEMDNGEKINFAGKKKEEGNELFKNAKYQQAAKRYTKAANYLDEGLFEDDAEKLAKNLRTSCWLNSAACNLKLNDFVGTIQLCSKVLDVESHNVKAIYRRAQGYIGTFDLDLAELDIKKALEIDPLNREIQSISKTLKQLQSERNKRDAKLYSDMFRKMRTDSLESKRLKVEVAGEGMQAGKAIDGKHEDHIMTDSSEMSAL